MPSAGKVRGVLALMLSLGLAACAGAPPTRWARSGVDDATTAKDESDCRETSRREAARRHPYGFGPAPYTAAYADASLLSWQHSVEAERFADETRLTEMCMRNKGYARTPVPSGSR